MGLLTSFLLETAGGPGPAQPAQAVAWAPAAGPAATPWGVTVGADGTVSAQLVRATRGSFFDHYLTI